MTVKRYRSIYSEQEYSETEIADVFRDAEQKLGQMILGENTSLDEVRSDLNLFSSIPDTGISMEWVLIVIK